MTRHDRYHAFEKGMTAALLTDTGLFVVFLLTSGWVETLCGVLALVVAAAGLVLLALRQELLRQRSLWLSCGFFAVMVCTVVSMILNYP